MASNVTRDHHRWTRDIKAPQDTEIDVTGDLTLDVSGNITIDADGGTVTIADTTPSALSPTLKLASTESGGYGPFLHFSHASVSPAALDYLGYVAFDGKNDNGDDKTYVSFLSTINDPTDGSEDGKLQIGVLSNDSVRYAFILTGQSDGTVHVNLGYGTGSVTYIAGDVLISGDAITTAGALEIDAGGQLSVTGQDMSVDNDKKVIFGDAGEYIVGDGTDLLIASGRHIALSSGGSYYLDSTNGAYYFRPNADVDDHFKIITVEGTGATTLETVSAAADGHLSIVADGDLTLDSNSGNFIAKKAGTEFSAANSAYAGMILGYTNAFHATTVGSYTSVTTSWVSLVWNTDKYALVTFVVPPSNKVEIKVHLPYILSNGNLIQLGLATNNAASSLGTKYENKVWDVDETDAIGINYSWVVDGSDHSWAAGETKTLYVMAYAAGAIRIYTGGTNTGYYTGVTVQAIALPATIGDGCEP